MGWPDDARYLTVVDGATLLNADLLNNIQDGVILAQHRARVNYWNQLIPRLRLSSYGTGISTEVCYAPAGYGAFIKVTATALRSTNAAGDIIQEVDVGVTALGYHLEADELLTNHAAAHATLDRYDIICVKLEATSPGVIAMAKQVVAGANAAAGTAVEPAIPAGYCKWAAVLIPAAHAAVFTEDHLRDWRVPCGAIQHGRLVGDALQTDDMGTLAVNQMTATGANQHAVAFLPRAPMGRVLILRVRAKISVGGYIKLQRTRNVGGVWTVTDLINAGDTAGADAGVHLVQESSAPPIWGSGFAHPNYDGFDRDEGLLVDIMSGANGDTVTSVQWELAD